MSRHSGRVSPGNGLLIVGSNESDHHHRVHGRVRLSHAGGDARVGLAQEAHGSLPDRFAARAMVEGRPAGVTPQGPS